MKFIKNNKSTILLLISIVIGTIIGIIFKEDAVILKPFGDLFINALFMVIVPLIFLTITTSIFKLSSKARFGKVMISTIITFFGMSIVALLVSFAVTLNFNLVDANKNIIPENVNTQVVEDVNILSRTVDVFTVSDFSELFSKDNIIALIVFSILFGFAILKLGNKVEPLKKVLLCTNDVILKIVEMILLYAPIGLGCYFASVVGSLGVSIAVGYFKTFVLYFTVAVLYYLIVYSLFAYLAGGKRGFVSYLKNILPPTLTAFATCSSAASIPVNQKCSRNIGVSSDISDTVIPLGTSFHKDGSIIGSVFKIMFVVYLMGINISDPWQVLKILSVAFIANLLISAVPIGGGTISETMILSLMGLPMSLLPILTIIATIIDAPATVLNVTGDTVSSMIVSRIVDGKNWIKRSIN
ncbi:MAG: dicarboxylate/amino acid:cation symporter [Bacilli bacterium]|nr:dicarboxylate/amino acid:cation symporter [Bacilli bacterium]